MAVADDCNGRDWPPGGLRWPTEAIAIMGFRRWGISRAFISSGGDDWLLGDQEAFDDGHVFYYLAQLARCGGGAFCCALCSTGLSVAKRRLVTAGLIGILCQLGGIGAGGVRLRTFFLVFGGVRDGRW